MGGEYLVQLGPVVYTPNDGRDGWTLPEAMREVHGVGEARVLRGDLSVAVSRAGSDFTVWHVARSGRITQVTRRRVRRARFPGREVWNPQVGWHD